MSIPDLAQQLGVNRNTLGAYERAEGALPDADFLAAFARITNTDFDELLRLRQADSEGKETKYVLDVLDEMRRGWHVGEEPGEYIGLPVYEVRAAAGGGAMIEKEEISDVLMFKRSWLDAELHANAKDLSLIYVEGESMEPTLRAGDIILVDRRDIAAQREGIYVMRADNALLVKRLQRLPGHRLRISSDNPAYQPFEMDLKQRSEEFAIIGRVVWAGRRM